MIEENLRKITQRAQDAGVTTLLLGMQLPRNYGPEYAKAFAAIFPRVAHETGSALVPFLLEGVAGQTELNLPDGIHPNAEGQKIVARTVIGHLEPMVKELFPEITPAQHLQTGEHPIQSRDEEGTAR
jgi:acyl-CoA thioesterase-1